MRWFAVFLVALMAFVPTASFWPDPAHAQGNAGGAAQQRNAGGLTVPIAGSNSFLGSFTITRFAVQDGNVVALGTLVGTVLDPATGTTRTIVTSIAMPVDTQASGGIGTTQVCDILHLVLGPLHLDLLGLVIDLNQVELDIVAQPGPGKLLGNLLCAIVGLLDGGGALTQLAALLNQLLQILG